MRAPIGVMIAVSLAAPLRAQSFAAADSAVQAGIRAGIYPGAVLVIGRRDTVLHARGFGHLTWWRKSAVPDPGRTLFDLASLTKVVATTGTALLLVDQGRLRLDAPVGQYLPRWHGGARDRVTVRMLLNHTSGLRAWAPYFREARTREGTLALLYEETPRSPPGTSAEYSDLNAMLLGLVIEKVSGQPLDQFAAGALFAPLGMSRTTYRPGRRFRGSIAPTGLWRGHPVFDVNDQNAVRLGGVSGHAGLFSTGLDLARYAQWWLRRGMVGNRRLVSTAVMQTFLAPEADAGTRLLGWESPDPDETDVSSFGSLLSPAAYGHTGWTGTEMWIDPTRDLFVIFLTNRSYHPRTSRSITRLRAVRASVSDATVRAAAGCILASATC